MEWNFFVASSDAMLFVAWIYFVRVVVSGYMVCSGYRNTDLLQFVGIAVCASRAGVELQVEVNDDEKMSRITFLLMMMYYYMILPFFPFGGYKSILCIAALHLC